VSPVSRSPALVGRSAELATGRSLVDAVLRGDGSTLLVTGEAGIGKSRLLGEVAARATDADLTVLRGRSVQGGGTYRPVAEALARPLRELPLLESARLRPFRAALRRLVPGWDEAGARDESAEAGQGPVSDPTVVLGEGVLALLRELDGGRGCVLLLEDLHWADADTLGLLSYLADAVPGTPVLLALTARDDVAVPGVVALGAHPAVRALGLTRLDDAEVAALAAACRGGAPLAEPELRALVARSEGLPFLVEELLDSGRSPSQVPPTLAGLVAGRLAALPSSGRPVLVAAAVVAGDPDWRLLSTVTGAPEAAVLDALRAAAGVGLLTAEDGRLRWRHALTRDAVLATLLPPEAAALAARGARVLDERGEPGDRAAAAELFVTAGEWGRAAEILVELARRDAARGALHSADELLVRATLTGRFPGAVAAERVRVLTLLGRVAEALELGTAVLDAGSVAGDEHAQLCLRLARAAVAGGRWADAEGFLERAGRPADPRSLVLAADAAFGAGDVGRAAALARAAVDTVEAAPRGAETERAATLCEGLMVLARSAIGSDLDASASDFRRAAQVAAEHALTPWRVEALFGLGSVELSSGDPAAPSLAEARELAVQFGMLARAVQADLLRSDAVLLVDGARAARPIAELAGERAGRLRHSALQAMSELMAAAAAALTGDLRAMTALLAAASSRANPPAEVVALAPAVRALPHLVGHDLPRAATLFDEGIPVLLTHGSAAPISYFGLWALLRTAVADRDEAARDTVRHHHTTRAVTNRAALTYADAIAAGRAGHRAEATARFAEADAAMAAMPWWNRLLRLIALEAAVADGWGDPVPALRADLAAHEQAGEPALARTCRDLLRTAGAPTRRGRGSAPVPPALRGLGITSREADVLALVTEGHTNAQIAAQLFLSSRTVETHVARLLAKTGTAGRGELRAWSAAHGAGRASP
jgi:DNA-binding CsgD family transcriptional regulator